LTNVSPIDKVDRWLGRVRGREGEEYREGKKEGEGKREYI